MNLSRTQMSREKGTKSKTGSYERAFSGEMRAVSDDKRQVELSFSSEQPYSRWFGTEILCHDAGCVNLGRMTEVGSLLFHHGRDGSYGALPIGRIIDVSLDDAGKRCRATVEFDSDEKSDLIYQKVKNGSIKGVSVGYQIDALEEVKTGKTSSNGRFIGPCCVAVKWTPYEISIEPVPADNSVGIGRNFEQEDVYMDENEKTTAETTEGGTAARQTRNTGNPPPIPAAAPAVPDETSLRMEGAQAERERSAAVEALCRTFGIDPEPYKSGGNTLDEVRAAVLEQLAKKNKPVPAANVEITADEEDRFRSAAVDGMLMRMGFRVPKPADGAEQFRGLSLRSLAAGCLQRSGMENTATMDDSSMLRAALGYDETRSVYTPNSAFASVVNNTLGAVISRGYIETPTTFEKWTGKGSNPNFKTTKRFRLSAAGEMVEVNQNGEFKKDEIMDEGVDTRLKTYGKTFGFTRQTFIDDDLGTVAKAVQAQVRSCKRTINKKVYALLGGDVLYTDKKKLFSVDHGNLGKSAALGVDSLGELYIMMGKQKDLGGKAFLNITPKYLIIPMTLSMEAFRLLRSASDPLAPNAGVVNPVQNLVEIVADAELDQYSEKAFYLACSPMDVDTIEVTYLNGKEEPTLENRIAWDTLGIEYRMYHDFTVSSLDYRGLAKNEGGK